MRQAALGDGGRCPSWVIIPRSSRTAMCSPCRPSRWRNTCTWRTLNASPVGAKTTGLAPGGKTTKGPVCRPLIRTCAIVRMSGRQTGPFVVFPPGARPVVFAPTGLAFSVRQVHVFRHRDGRHGEHIAVRDDLGMMTQLGHLPPSPRAAWRMARTALTGYRARAVREAIWVSTDAAAGVTAAVPSDHSLRAALRHELIRSSHLNMPCHVACLPSW